MIIIIIITSILVVNVNGGRISFRCFFADFSVCRELFIVNRHRRRHLRLRRGTHSTASQDEPRLAYYYYYYYSEAVATV